MISISTIFDAEERSRQRIKKQQMDHEADITHTFFAPADFGDADDHRPAAVDFDLTQTGNSTPQSTTLNHIVAKHRSEVEDKVRQRYMITAAWKKRLREFLDKKNEKLLDFLNLSTQSHPTLRSIHALFSRFGSPTVKPHSASVRDQVLDLSGNSTDLEIQAILKECWKGEDPLKEQQEMTTRLLEKYCEAGERIFYLEEAMRIHLDTFDRVNQRVISLFEMDPNEKQEPLLEATEGYMKQIQESHPLEESQKQLIEGQRRVATLREAVTAVRSIVSKENEPLCSVCLSDTVQQANVPCGHTFCRGCQKKQQLNCHICRGMVSNSIKIQFS